MATNFLLRVASCNTSKERRDATSKRVRYMLTMGARHIFNVRDVPIINTFSILGCDGAGKKRVVPSKQVGKCVHSTVSHVCAMCACEPWADTLTANTHTHTRHTQIVSWEFRRNCWRTSDSVCREMKRIGDFVRVFVLTSNKNNVNWLPISCETIYMDIK